MPSDSYRYAVLGALLAAGCGPTPMSADGGVPGLDGGPITCAELGFAGRCVGNELQYCPPMATEVVRADCTADAPHLACTEGLPDWGADCVAGEGETCGFVYMDGSDFTYLCTGSEPGCVWSSMGAVCTSFVGTCAEADVGTCRGSLQIFGCRAGQVAANDCASWGGSCSGGLCVDIDEGGWCADGRSTCATGLSCVDNQCMRSGGSATLTLSVLTNQDGMLRNHHAHLYASEPRAYLGDRPSDVPAPIATASFTDWVATFEGLVPGTYWYDFQWIADTGRIAYGVGQVEIAEGANSVTADWRYTSFGATEYDYLDYADPWAILVFHSGDPAIGSTTPLTAYVGPESLSVRVSQRGGAPAIRCGDVSLPQQYRVALLPPGTYSVRGAMNVGSELYVWRPRNVTVAADQCVFVDMGIHDCVGIGC